MFFYFYFYYTIKNKKSVSTYFNVFFFLIFYIRASVLRHYRVDIFVQTFTSLAYCSLIKATSCPQKRLLRFVIKKICKKKN